MLEPSGIVETFKYDELQGTITTCTTYDNSEILKDNLEAQKYSPDLGRGRYKGNLVHVGSIHIGDMTRLYNMGYNLYSPDADERRRALCYIQDNEPWLLTVPGKPFAKQRKKWA